MRLVLATRNAHKAREFAALLAPHDVDPLPDARRAAARDRRDVRRERARQGARRRARRPAARRSPTTRASPPRRSTARPACARARFAGEDATDEQNLDKLCARRPAGSRVAYVCALAYVDAGRHASTSSRAAATGTLAAEPRGTGGFGYDPAFVPDEHPRRRTMAELDAARRRTRSATAASAARALLAWLPPT